MAGHKWINMLIGVQRNIHADL